MSRQIARWAVALTLVAVANASGATPYTAENITCPMEYICNVMDFNNLGHATFQTRSGRAFLWDGHASIRLSEEGGAELDTPYGVNDSDRVVGTMTDFSHTLSASWEVGTVTQLDLGSLFGDSMASAINNAGLIAGTSDMPDGRHLYTIDPSGTARDHGLLAVSRLEVSGLNERGQIVMVNPGPLTDGCLWENGQFTPLPDLLGGRFGAPKAINDNGLAVGMSWPGQTDGRAVCWQDGQAPVALAVPDDTTISCANDVNNLGQIVGWYSSSLGRRPCLWDADGSFYDLMDLLETEEPLWLNDALCINDAGQIVVLKGSCVTAYILNPIPEPTTLGLVGLGLSAILVRRRRRR